jgi:hypothetical protein
VNIFCLIKLSIRKFSVLAVKCSNKLKLEYAQFSDEKFDRASESLPSSGCWLSIGWRSGLGSRSVKYRLFFVRLEFESLRRFLTMFWSMSRIAMSTDG